MAELRFTSFHPKIVHGTISGYSNYGCRCTACTMENTKYKKIQYENNKDRFAGYNLKRHYGMTFEERNEILIAQNGRCAVCNIKEEEGGRSLHVDHNHKTGEIRGLLCGNCNHALGKLKEDERIVRSLLKYLRERNKND